MMLDDIWDGALDAFSDDSHSAFVCAQAFSMIKEALTSGPEGQQAVIKALDDGIAKLYPYSEIHRAGFELYLLGVEGNLKPQYDITQLALEARHIEPVRFPRERC